MQMRQILPLPPEVQSQIKASIAITSLSDVVIELIKNSLDAHARTAYIDVDYLSGGCCVEDDGDGIPAGELSEYGHLGSMYCTSKHNPSNETYGSHGRFISCLSALSLLSITSRHRAGADECSVLFHESQVIVRSRTTQEHQRVLQKIHGTKVTVRHLFRKLPVRVKHRAIQYEFQENLDKEFEELKRKIVSLLLAWSRPVKIVLSDTGKRRRSVLRLDRESSPYGEGDSEIYAKLPFRPNWICALLFQAGYIVRSSFASWVTASAQTLTTSIRAAISLEPAPTKQLQFVSFGIRPVDPMHGSQVILGEVNRIFALSSFGAIDNDNEISEDEKSRRQFDKRYKSDDNTTRPLRGIAKGADRWPMFYIRVDSSSEHRMPDDDQAHDPGGEAVQVLNKVMQLLKTLIHQFLEEHQFRPRVRRQNRRKENHTTAHMPNPFNDPVIYLGSNEVSSQPVQTTTSTAGPTPQPNASRLQRRVTGQGFDSWSRVKSGKRDGLDHILSGLPQSKRLQDETRLATAPVVSSHSNNSIVDIGQIALAVTKSQPSVEYDVQILLQDLQNEELLDGVRPSVISTSDAPTTAVEDALRNNNIPTDETIQWTSPTTGRVVYVNSRTGLTVPNIQMQDADDEANDEKHSNEPFSEALVSRADSARSMWLTHKTMKAGLHVAPESWIGRLLKGSETSIFRPLEAAIPSVAPEEVFRYDKDSSCRHSRPIIGDLGQVSALFNVVPVVNRLSKGGLDDAQVLAQVDRKFILVRITTGQTHARTDSPNSEQPPEETVLVLIDQHAADERCQVEALYAELCNVETAQLPTPIHFKASEKEVRLFDLQKDFFAHWGFSYEIHNGDAQSAPQFASLGTKKRTTSAQAKDDLRITVTALPNLVAERCRLDHKILINLLRSEIWARAENRFAKSRPGVAIEESESTQPDLNTSCEDRRWLTKISTCPKGLIEMLNSRACRSAVMFNDVLSKAECKALVKRLAKCSFPFQCAHGRPSMVVLGGLKVVDAEGGWPLGPSTLQDDVERGVDFTRAFDKWQANVRKGPVG